jgi:hypothetical protein
MRPRVERANRTLQDRLVKELRLAGINNRDDANRFAPTFLGDYNQRFARAPSNPHDAHRPLRADEDLNEVFRWKEQRTLTQNLAVHYKGRLYVVEESPEATKQRRRLVQVHELEDGTVIIRHGAHKLKATSFRKGGAVRQQDVVDNKYLTSTLERIRRAQIANDLRQLESKKMTKRGSRRRHEAGGGVVPGDFLHGPRARDPHRAGRSTLPVAAAQNARARSPTGVLGGWLPLPGSDSLEERRR